MKLANAQIISRLTDHIGAAKNGSPDNLERWKQTAAVLLRAAVGSDDPLNKDLRGVRYSLGAVSNMTTETQYEAARRRGVLKAVAILEAAITQIEVLDELSPDKAPATTPGRTAGSEIFIVHGRDEGVKEMVARFIDNLTGTNPIILHEQADIGSTTLIEKFESVAERVGYAVVLATADDLGRAVDDTDEKPRARQNVVFEMGYFFGLLKRKNVCFLYQPGVEAPSDLNGIVYVELDTNRGWRITLANSLEAAGFEVDRNALR